MVQCKRLSPGDKKGNEDRLPIQDGLLEFSLERKHYCAQLLNANRSYP